MRISVLPIAILVSYGLLPTGVYPQIQEPTDAEIAAAQAQNAETRLGPAFQAASTEFDVPVDLLLAVGYVETRWTHNAGLASIDGGWGVMHLVRNEYADTLGEAAALLAVDVETVKSDATANIRGAAALLRRHAGDLPPAGLEGWTDALLHLAALYDVPTSALQVRTYYETLRAGAQAVTAAGERLEVKPQPVGDVEMRLSRLVPYSPASDDYGPAIWNPADSSNYSTGRGGNTVQYWINHWIGTGTYAGAISWFKNPSSNVSAHFVCRASDGELTQMVRFADTAWHAGNFTYNQRSIGIEHDAAVGRESDWNSVPMLQASTTACRTVCDRYGIPKTRTYILGHKEVPGASTSCPGPLPWDTYMNMVNQVVTPTPTPTTPPAGVDDILIESRQGGQNVAWYTESGSFADSAATCTAPGCTANIGSRYGSTYRSVAGLKEASFAPNIIYAGPYEVFVAWPAGPNRRATILHRVIHTQGTTEFNLDQSQTANVWVSLGTFSFAAGNAGRVVVSNASIDESGSMYAAAAKFVYRGGVVQTATPTATPSRTPTPTPTLTPTPSPPLADLDGDGLPDALEDPVPGAGRTNRLLADSDGDGLQDGTEDANRNGIRDTGETDPRNRDSDGDGLMDGVELVLFAPGNPLDPNSPGIYVDADGDGLPSTDDFNDNAKDTDGDRYTDGYEIATVGRLGYADPFITPGLGDVNQDGTVTNVDALAVQSLFLSLIGPDAAVFAGRGFSRSDANRDGYYTNVDALLIQSFFLRITALLP